jgi:lipoprotein-anchoring transpeptidase ErfK/SrfK
MEQAMGPGGIYWKLRDGTYVPYNSITIIRKQPRRYNGIGPNDKWVEVRVTWGYLAAYKGDDLEYVTAISPGVDGINAAKHATARGKHFVDWKLYSGDMSGKDKGKPWYVDEVPWVQYYKGNYALHGAWWHNNFGRPMSHGCINLSPPDAKALFEWMDPVVPDGWYAVAAYYPHAKGTMVYIRP